LDPHDPNGRNNLKLLLETWYAWDNDSIT
jgi:hypothetical protein